MNNAMTRPEKDDVALEIEDHANGQSTQVLRQLPKIDAWIRESAFAERDARDLHALLGDRFITE